MIKIKEEKAVTLTALIIAIIVILIIAGVTIYIAIGENGIITKSKEGVSAYTEQSVREKTQLKLNDWQMELLENNSPINIENIKKIAEKDEDISKVIENEDGLKLIIGEYQCQINDKLQIVGAITVYNPEATIMKVKANPAFCTIER